MAPKWNMKEGFKYAYEETIKSIVNEDYDYMSQSLEGHLYDSFWSNIEILKGEGYKMKILNAQKPWFELEPQFFHWIIGAKPTWEDCENHIDTKAPDFLLWNKRFLIHMRYIMPK